jgi:serine/threonine protein kinase
MNTCQREDSARFLAGRMTAQETTLFEDHLETCAECRGRLEHGAGSALEWQSARELLADAPLRAGRGDSTAAPGRPRSTPDSDWLPDCTSAVVLSFLAPTDDPAMVGRVGPYEISGILGRGSAGIVLKGFDRALYRNVAIKVLDPALAGVGAARQRFAREARAMAAISNEHLVPVYEVSEHAGLPFFVMEYVPGGSLERRIQAEGPIDVVSVVRIGLQTAQALSAAHQQGLVHRDIKPGNILLDRGTERVRVADFGLVRVANDASCTRSGCIAGTPQYMAPEQVRAETCDAQSDLFSLGAVLYSLCTGHSPFRADTVYGVMQRIVHDQPRSIREQNPHIPDWLEQFILRLLAKDRSARFPSAQEVVGILHQELACLQKPERSVAPHREWLADRASNPLCRRKRAAIAAAGVLAIVALGAGLVHWLGPQDPLKSQAEYRQQQSAATAGEPAHVKPTALLWDADGTRAVRDLANAVETSLHGALDRESTDAWRADVQRLRRQLADWSDDNP